MNEIGGVFTREKQEDQSQTGDGMMEIKGQKAFGRCRAAGSEDEGRGSQPGHGRPPEAGQVEETDCLLELPAARPR